MRKELNMMLIMVVCAVLGVVCAVIAGQLYTEGILLDSLLVEGLTIGQLQFAIFFVWLIGGMTIGVLKN